jgi:site-specific DNA recombinase
MRCAIYARRSTEEHQIESLDVQIENATRYIESKGWTLAPDHVYRDDGISRAEFVKRRGLASLLNAVEKTPRIFDAVIVRDDSRIGGDIYRAGFAIQKMIEHGVRLFYHSQDKEVSLTGARDRLIMAVMGGVSEIEREQTAARVLEHMEYKARRGLNVGGRVFGYANVRGPEGVSYQIDAAEAAIVVEVYEMRAAGVGLREIAKELRCRGVPPPKRRTSGIWSWTTIRAILHNERYRGVIVYGREGKTYRGGTRVRFTRPEADSIRVERTELRIVSEELWQKARARDGRKDAWKAGTAGPAPRYMLSGLARCAGCGAPIWVHCGRHGTKRVPLYACSRHRNVGPDACASSLRRPVSAVDAAVIAWIEANVLREEVIGEVLQEVRRRLEARKGTSETELAELEGEGRRLRAEIDRLVDALAAGTVSPTIARSIDEREKRLSQVQARRDVLRTAPDVLDLEVRRLEREARARLADFRALLERKPTEARKALEALLDGPLTFAAAETPGGRRYQITGKAAVGNVFTTEGDPTGIRTPVTGVRGRCPNH